MKRLFYLFIINLLFIHKIYCFADSWVVSIKEPHKIEEFDELLSDICVRRVEYPQHTIQNLPDDWNELKIIENCSNNHLERLSKNEVEQRIKTLFNDKLNFIYFQEQKKRFHREVKDPLYKKQWHLHKDNETTIDVDILGVWEREIYGKGVVIAIVDDGIEIKHPEIEPNYNEDSSWDFVFNRADPTSPNYHGTSCAGVAAGASNSHCGVGVAYQSQISGIRLITDSLATDYNEGKALVYQYDINDIYSCSWGPSDDGYTLEGPGPLAIFAIQHAVATGRKGKGSIYVWAAGNGLLQKDNCNYDGYVNLIQTIAVGAVDNMGKQSYYSEPGASMLLCAPSSGTDLFIITADLSGSDGVSKSECNSEFGGTSSATPLVAGIIALMLEKNENLGWRDVQYILIQNTIKNDANDQDWSLNGAGYHVNHKYGFGMVDAFNSVISAELWVNVAKSENISNKVEVNKKIPDNNGQSINSTFEITTSGLVEHVELRVNIDHPQFTDLQITLTSPSGTVSILSQNHGYVSYAKLETVLPNGVIFTATGTWVSISATLDDDITAPLAITQPDTACNSAKGFNGDDLNGKIALVKKGDCSCFEKLKPLMKLNPVAVVVYDDQNENIFTIQETGEATVPVGFITKSNGTLLVDLLTNGTTLIGTLYNTTSKHPTTESLNDWTFMTVRNWGEDAKGNWTVNVIDLDGPISAGFWNSYTLNVHAIVDVNDFETFNSQYNSNDEEVVLISVVSGGGGAIVLIGVLVGIVIGIRVYDRRRKVFEIVESIDTEMDDFGELNNTVGELETSLND